MSIFGCFIMTVQVQENERFLVFCMALNIKRSKVSYFSRFLDSLLENDPDPEPESSHISTNSPVPTNVNDIL